ncbi:MAG: IS110 family transposase [Candidatus Eisenbacteria bacterium]
MRFYTKEHLFYCGVDLHTRSMYVCVLDDHGDVVLHRNIPAEPDAFLEVIQPYREDIVVCAECMFAWYWLADLCHRETIPFVLDHALYMRAIHGGKAKNDRVDSRKIAGLLRGGMIPQAYVYPPEMRATRDLLRRRHYLMRRRADLLGHIQNTNSQYNLPPFGKKIAYKTHRAGVAEQFSDPDVSMSISADLELIDHYDQLMKRLELFILKNARHHDSQSLYLLKTVPGIGKILSLAILYEIHDISRFPTVSNFVSYARLVACSKESAGKKYGTSGRKIGNMHLKWAFSEGMKYRNRLQARYGKAKSLSILAHKLGRAVYFVLLRQRAFDMKRFLSN